MKWFEKRDVRRRFRLNINPSLIRPVGALVSLSLSTYRRGFPLAYFSMISFLVKEGRA